ncbi:MAG: nitrile hydratase accessory protein [Pseudomonadota bacterium]
MNAPEAPFDAPWQAQLFALTVALNEAEHITWTEWTAAFGPRVQMVGPEAYWDAWAQTLVCMLQDLEIAQASDIAELAARWKSAARATPHGMPIFLQEQAGWSARH